MRTLTTHIMFVAAALAAVAGSASAQTYKADIPMSFQVANKTMAAGSYEVRTLIANAGNRVFAIRNTATDSTAAVVSYPGVDTPKAWETKGDPVLSFTCLGNNCALRRVWDGKSATTYEIPFKKLRPVETERLSQIVIGLTKAD
jgi:hypothetical protein